MPGVHQQLHRTHKVAGELDAIFLDDMDELTVREMRNNDLPGLLELYLHYGESQLPIKDTIKAEACWSRIENDKNIYYFVGEYNEKIVTSCFLLIFPQLTRDGRPYGLIENVITHKEYRKRGFATAVLKLSLELAWKQDCYQVMLMTGNKTDETLCLYKKVGLVRGLKEGFIAYKP